MRDGVALGGVLGVLAALPFLAGVQPYHLYVLATAFLFATVASAWNLLALTGQVSFGHAGFFGVGAYAAALGSLQGLPVWGGIALGGLAGAATAVLMGLAAGRLRGAYLALGTLAYAELWRGLVLNWTELTGGGAGLVGIPPLPVPAWLPATLARGRGGEYYLTLGLLSAVLAVFALVLRSRIGLAFAALREGEDRASLLGLRPLPWKVLAFALSALFTGLAGGLYAHMVRVVEPDLVFNRYYSILPLIMATVGGLHTLLGPALAGVGLYLLTELVLTPLTPAVRQMAYALALIVVILYLPGGLAGLRPRGLRARP